MVVFKNKGLLDLQVLSTFGVSIKETDSPIGYFGTGLKFALAVLMREKQEVEIWIGEHKYCIGLEKTVIRDVSKNMVVLVDCESNEVTKLGFTDELGKNWGVRHAYRELHCNTLDEKGEIFDITAANYLNQVGFAPDETNIIVKGDKFLDAYRNRGDIILQDEPLLSLNYQVEIRDRVSTNIYYRKIDVFQTQKTALFCYNFNNGIELTEDRTIKNSGSISTLLAWGWLSCTDKKLIKRVLLAKEGTLEHSFDFDGGYVTASDQFIESVGDLIANRSMDVNSTALSLWGKVTKKPLNPTAAVLTKVQKTMLSRAIDFLTSTGYNIREYTVNVVEQLGAGTLGLAHDDQIYITIQNFNMGGTKAVASVLMEEYIHLKYGVKDCTREMQQHLFDALLSALEEAKGEPL